MATPKDMIQEAKARLESGKLVAIPTETVYGLAAPISNDESLKMVFAVKGRPAFDPLIVHVATIEDAKKLVTSWPKAADVLAKEFWPGPLSLVLPKTMQVSELITSGLPTVAVRVPNHPLTLELLRLLGGGLAAPSANRFGKTSPTTAEHVQKEFPGEDIFVLDGGPTTVGLESTIVKIDWQQGQVQLSLLRPGMLTFDEISECLDRNGVSHTLNRPADKQEAPGHLQQHYMPAIPLILIAKGHQISEVLTNASTLLGRTLATSSELRLNQDPILAARELYGQLRKVSESGADCMIFHCNSEQRGAHWEAIFDRLERAASLDLRA